jgi:DNA-directed RNA polymerase specialized sigma subunit
VKLKVEGTAEELVQKGPELVKSLARKLGVDPLDLVHPDDIIQKAESQPTLRYDMLKGLHEKERRIVQDTYKSMVKEIGKVLDGAKE